MSTTLTGADELSMNPGHSLSRILIRTPNI
jgi:hypothetical protein